MTSKPRARTNRLLAVLASGFLLALSSCGGGAEVVDAPSTVCSPDLEIGTPCIPADDHFVHEAFAGRSTPAEANELMEDGRFGGSLVCAEKPEDSVMCVMAIDGAAVAYPLDMPDNRKIEFSGGDLDESVTMELGEGVPVGVRAGGTSMRVSVLIEREVDGDAVLDEYYFVNTLEIEVPAGPAPVQLGNEAEETDE